MKKVPIRFSNLGTVLSYLGMLYRHAADALKEHISNALDEHLKAHCEHLKTAQPVCLVNITMKPDSITIEYPYAMSEFEFKDVLQRVASSIKTELRKKGITQIGQKAIGMWSVFHLGKKAVFTAWKSEEHDQISVTVREGSEEAEFESVKKHDQLKKPGIRIVISQLRLDPTKDRGPLCRARLESFFAEKFNPFLRDGVLKIVVREPKGTYEIQPIKVELPRIAETYSKIFVSGDKCKQIRLELYFDNSGKGNVSIRHTRVSVVEDLKTLSAYGLEESIFTGGFVKGHIDADFLTPLPGRINFEENDEWLNFLAEMEKIRPAIEAEVEMLKEQEAQQRLGEIQRRAFKKVMEILQEDEFKDLELLQGLYREQKEREPRLPPKGFDFIPSSVRVNPGEEGHIVLKAVVPSVIDNRTVVHFSIDDPSIEISPKKATLYAKNSDEYNVVAIKVKLTCKNKTQIPATLKAEAKTPDWTFTAEAMVRFAEAEHTRNSRGGVNYQEKAFEDGPRRHSRYESQTIMVNTLNPDYKEQMSGSEQHQMAYLSSLIFKETLAFNDKSGKTDEFLEKMLTFSYRLRKEKAKK
ncbi:MAG: hypothetical protein PHU56_04600 [Candidatus Pacebacteria bacterium]|nr:hypothetical protein [Candidatus Paceibacterota bacterium]